MVVGKRIDPYLSSRFLVEIEGLVVGGFSEVSGLQIEIETEEKREGGVNEYTHKLSKGTKYPNLVLKRGMTDSDELWSWFQKAASGNITRKSGRIILLDSEGNEKWDWGFKEAYPVKWTGPDFKANSNNVAIESLELVHKGLEKITR